MDLESWQLDLLKGEDKYPFIFKNDCKFKDFNINPPEVKQI